MSGQPALAELARLHGSGEQSIRATVEACLGAIAERPELGAIASVEPELALARAAELERERGGAGAEGRPLFGVPFVFKANLCCAGFESHCGSRMLAGWRAPYTATALERLAEAGAIALGVAHMDEFAMGSSGEHSAFGPARNPWDTQRAPGGSSSGSAVAVAAGLAPFALGSDTGGSVRQPASLCGITGFKPTYGRVSRYGLVAFASSLDQVSPLARTARDCELVFAALSGRDPRDATALALEPHAAPSEAPPARLDGLRLGVAREYFPAELDAAVRAEVEAALAQLEGLGARLVEVDLPHTALALATYYVIATAEASANLARYDGVRYGLRARGAATESLAQMMEATRAAGFGREVERRILLGTYVLSAGYSDAWYERARRVRTLVARDFERAFERVDLVAGPTSPTPAFRLGERSADPVAMYLSDTFTVPASLAGLPAISVPCGRARPAGGGELALPVGLQLIGPALQDGLVLRVAATYQAHSEHHAALPPGARAARPEGARP